MAAVQVDNQTYEKYTKIIAIWSISVAAISFFITLAWIIYQFKEKEREKKELQEQQNTQKNGTATNTK
jgi:NADH:ubiquinone oxidoreductase subunit K